MIGMLDRGCIYCGIGMDEEEESFIWIKDKEGVDGFICAKCGNWSPYI